MRMVLNGRFWANVKFIVDFIQPIYEVIKFAYSNKPCLGEIYEEIDSLCQRNKIIKDVRDFYLYPLIEEKVHGRWNKLNTSLHCVVNGHKS